MTSIMAKAIDELEKKIEDQAVAITNNAETIDEMGESINASKCSITVVQLQFTCETVDNGPDYRPSPNSIIKV